MSITKIREVPSKLPAARLYLDDIAEITGILADTCKTKAADKPAVLYKFGDGKNDAQATSIEDLKEIGGSVNYFTIDVTAAVRGSSFPDGEVVIRDTLSPEVRYLYGLDDNVRRATFQKIEAIFRHRQLAMKNALSQLPSWVGYFAFGLNLIVPPLILVMHVSVTFKIALGLLYAALFIRVASYSFQSSRVMFEYSYENTRHQTEVRRSALRDIVFLVLGTALGLLAQIIIKKWLQ
jgi:hypothetical protein